MSFNAYISKHRFVVATALAAAFVAASGAPALARLPDEIVIVNGAVRDASATSAESRADRSIPTLPVVYDEPSSGK